jgi:hypothetical protein
MGSLEGQPGHDPVCFTDEVFDPDTKIRGTHP